MTNSSTEKRLSVVLRANGECYGDGIDGVERVLCSSKC